MRKYLVALFLVIMIVPSVAMAAWWKPWTWGIFQRKTVPIENKINVPTVVAPTQDISKETKTEDTESLKKEVASLRKLVFGNRKKETVEQATPPEVAVLPVESKPKTITLPSGAVIDEKGNILVPAPQQSTPVTIPIQNTAVTIPIQNTAVTTTPKELIPISCVFKSYEKNLVCSNLNDSVIRLKNINIDVVAGQSIKQQQCCGNVFQPPVKITNRNSDVIYQKQLDESRTISIKDYLTEVPKGEDYHIYHLDFCFQGTGISGCTTTTDFKVYFDSIEATTESGNSVRVNIKTI